LKPTLGDLLQVHTNFNELMIRRLLRGPAGQYNKLEPGTPIDPGDAGLISLGVWLFAVPRFDEVQIAMVLGKIRPAAHKRMEKLWKDMDSHQDGLGITSFFLGVFENRYVSWSTMQEAVLDVQTGETLDEMPHKHMWNLVLDLTVLTGRLWADVRRLQESKDAEQRLHQAKTARSSGVHDNADAAGA